VATTYVPRVGVGASANFTTVNRTRGLSASLWALQALLALTCVMTGAM
jgi:hypothetical protein